MRLLFVGTGCGGGGTESHFASLASAMAGAGHEVAAVVRPGEHIYRELASAGGVRLYAGRFDRNNDPAGAASLWRAVRHFRPDWVVASFKREYLSAALAARAHGAGTAFFKHIVNMHPASVRLIPRLADRFIVPSEYLRDELVRRGAPARRLRVLPNPVDLRRFAPNAALRACTRAELGVGSDEVLIGFVGRLEAGKGIHEYAQALDLAMERSASLRALWVGDGEAAALLLERIWRSPHRDRHSHLGWLADVRSSYAAMDLLALPSIGPETFGRASIEAQAAGVPVLASRNGGIPETLADGETGLLLPAGDAPAWAEAIVRLAQDGPARARMGAAGRDFVQAHFCQRRIAADFERLLNDERAPA